MSSDRAVKRKMYSFQRINLKKRLAIMAMGLILPLVAISVFLLYELNVFGKSYDESVRNVTAANEYNVDFKEEFDAVLYQMVARSITKYEVESEVNMKNPDVLISDAEKAFEELRSTTRSENGRARLDSAIKLLITLRKRMNDINASINQDGSYEDNMASLDSDIRILTQLIQERISEYIYYETASMEEIRLELESWRMGLTQLVVALIIIVVGVTIAYYAVISRSITNPVADLELKLLQAQINPHFLYNTLDNIVWLAEDGRTEDVEGIVTSLSQFFRTTLAGGKDFISISEEIAHIEAYLQIQQFRYRDILSYEMKIPEDVKKYAIIKLTLQPVVENALYHGIKNKRGGGKIAIYAKDEGDRVVLTVEDNGIGMDQEDLLYLNNIIEGKVKPSSDNTGFGMANVAERMRLNYGNEYGIKVTSEYEKGTLVNITIPKRLPE